MNVRRVADSVVSTQLSQRIKELLRQSKHYQEELARVTEELDRLQCQIRDIAAPKNTDSQANSDGDEQNERQA